MSRFSPGRNDACPCGSGKKFKHCHGRAEAGPVDAEAGDNALDRAVMWLEARHHKAFQQAMAELADEVRPLAEDDVEPAPLDEETVRALFSSAAEHLVAEGELHTKRGTRRTSEVLLAADGCPLAPGQRRYIEALARSPLRLYTVTEVRRNEGMTLVDALDLQAEPLRVHERAASREAKVGMTLGARVLSINDRLELSGSLHPFSPLHTAQALASVRAEREAESAAGSTPADIDWITGLCIIEAWLQQWAGPAPVPRIVDASSGEPMLLITDHYALNDAAALAERLARESDVQGNAEHGWSRLVHGSDGFDRPVVSINPGRRPGRLSVFYKTQAAADAGRTWFEGIAGETVRHLTREITDPGAAMALADSAGGPEPTEAEVAELMRKVMRQHYEHWADEPVPMLGDLTPRDCISTPSGLERVKGLLRYYEESEAEQAAAQKREPISFDFLWEDLGLTR